MAPEQIWAARQKEVGPEADVYSLGVILFEMLDGDRPFDGTAETVRKKHREMAPPDVCTDVPGRLEALAHECLAKEAGDRPPSAEAIREELTLETSEERAAFERAKQEDTIEAWTGFIESYPEGWRAPDAEERLDELKQEADEKTRAIERAIANQKLEKAREQLGSLRSFASRKGEPGKETLNQLDEEIRVLTEWSDQRESLIKQIRSALEAERASDAEARLDQLAEHLSGRTEPTKDEGYSTLKERVEDLRRRLEREEWVAQREQLASRTEAAIEGIAVDPSVEEPGIGRAEKLLSQLESHIEQRKEVDDDDTHKRLKRALEERRSLREQRKWELEHEELTDRAKNAIGSIDSNIVSDKSQLRTAEGALAELESHWNDGAPMDLPEEWESTHARLRQSLKEKKEEWKSQRDERRSELAASAEELIEDNNFERARTQIEKLRQIAGDTGTDVQRLTQNLEQAESEYQKALQERQEDLVESVQASLDNENLERAEEQYSALRSCLTENVRPSDDVLGSLEREIEELRLCLRAREELTETRENLQAGDIETAAQRLQEADFLLAEMDEGSAREGLMSEYETLARRHEELRATAESVQSAIKTGSFDEARQSIQQLEERVGTEHPVPQRLREKTDSAERKEIEKRINRALDRRRLQPLEDRLTESDEPYFREVLSKVIETRDEEGQEELLCAAAKQEKLALLKCILEVGVDPDVPSLPTTALHKAARKNAEKAIDSLLEAGATPDEHGPDGRTPLHVAILHQGDESTGLLETLLDDWANPNVPDAEGRTPLHWTVMEGDRESARLLLKNEADIDVSDDHGETPLHMAVEKGRLEFTEMLLDAGARPTIETDATPPLHRAVQKESPELADTLLDAGADPDQRDEETKTPLHCAALEGHTQLARKLLGAGAEVNASDRLRRSPLRVAVASGHRSTVDSLLQAGADPDAGGSRGKTPLHCAAEEGHSEITRSLLEADATPDISDSQSRTALLVAAEEGEREVVEILIDAGAETDVADENGRSSLIKAITGGHTKMVEALVEGGASLDNAGNEEGSPLHEAVRRGHTQITNHLLNAGCRVDRQDEHGRTPLHEAVRKREVDAVKWLLEAGADVNLLDENRMSPIHYTMFGSYSAGKVSVLEADGHDILQMLLDRGADPDASIKGGVSLLHAATLLGLSADTLSESDRLDTKNIGTRVTKSLVEAGADPNCETVDGVKPLHQIFFRELPDQVSITIESTKVSIAGFDNPLPSVIGWSSIVRSIAEILLENGGNPNIYESDTDATPLHTVAKASQGASGREATELAQVARALLDAGADPNALIERRKETVDMIRDPEGGFKTFDSYEYVEQTPLDVCEEERFEDVIREYGGKKKEEMENDSESKEEGSSGMFGFW
jgi:cytohesin